jgi:uncharacterized membrane protein
MNKNLVRELDELKGAGVIDEATAERIGDYFRQKSEGSHNRLFVVFGVLGAILVGLGIVLIVAHNWDELSRPVKVFFSFLPLLAGQFCCGYALLKKQNSLAWRESSAAFLFFAVGSSISLISQVYHIHGDLSTFLFTWMLLCLPLVYLLRSSVTSLLYIAGITYYQVVSNYTFDIFSHAHKESFNYWWMLALAAPYYYSLFRNNAGSNYLIFHNWFVPLSLTISLGALCRYAEDLIYISYMSLFAIFYLAGTSEFFNHSKRRFNGYLVIGSLGTMHILLLMSFRFFWDHLSTRSLFVFSEMLPTRDFLAAFVLTALAGVMLYLRQKGRSYKELHPVTVSFLLYILIFMVGYSNVVVPVVFINLLVLACGVYTIRVGAKADHLGVLNYGLLTITALVVCRFFDSDMSFVVRGFLFVLVGAGFFVTNYLMLRKRKEAGA